MKYNDKTTIINTERKREIERESIRDVLGHLLWKSQTMTVIIGTDLEEEVQQGIVPLPKVDLKKKMLNRRFILEGCQNFKYNNKKIK